MIRRRSFLAAVLAAAAAPAFVRKLDSRLWLPAPLERTNLRDEVGVLSSPEDSPGSWYERRRIATAELMTADGPVLSQSFVYTPGALVLPPLDFYVARALTATGVRFVSGDDVRSLPFDSGEKFACTGDSIRASVKLVRPLGIAE